MDENILKNIIKLRSENMSLVNISKKLNKCTDTIREYLVFLGELPEIPIKKGGRHKKYKVNDNFFSKIDDENSAYILGFLFADGYVYKKRNGISMCLKRNDKYILEKISNILESNYPLVDIISQYDEKYNISYKSRLYIISKKMINDLEKYGCHQNKSDTLKFPLIDDNLRRHFMRGYFDGDGTVFITKQNIIRFGIVSTKEFCNVFLYYLPYSGKSKITKENRTNKNVYYISIGGTNTIKPIYHFLYDDATIFLNRKKEKFEQYFLSKNIIF